MYTKGFGFVSPSNRNFIFYNNVLFLPFYSALTAPFILTRTGRRRREKKQQLNKLSNQEKKPPCQAVL